MAPSRHVPAPPKAAPRAVSDAAPDFQNNIILLTDSYKLSHFRQYPPGTEVVYSYFESRGGKWDEVVFFGLQYFLMRYLEGEVVTTAKSSKQQRWPQHMGTMVAGSSIVRVGVHCARTEVAADFHQGST